VDKTIQSISAASFDSLKLYLNQAEVFGIHPLEYSNKNKTGIGLSLSNR
jgi:hypothetical protein